MRVTEKGQVTIPKDVRDRLGIKPGSLVRFLHRADGVVELVREDVSSEAAVRRGLDQWFATVKGTGDSGLSTDAIMAMTRDAGGHDDR